MMIKVSQMIIRPVLMRNLSFVSFVHITIFRTFFLRNLYDLCHCEVVVYIFYLWMINLGARLPDRPIKAMNFGW